MTRPPADIAFIPRPGPSASRLAAAAAPTFSPGTGVNRAQHRLNGVTAVLLVAIVALAPIPLASNRPAFWLAWAVAIGGLGVAYGLGILLVRGAVRSTLAGIWPEALLMLAFAGFLVFQMLPVGPWLPQRIAFGDGQSLALPTFSLAPSATRQALVATVAYCLFFMLFLQVGTNRRRARRLLLALLFVIAAFAAYGLVALTQLGDTLLGFDKQYYRGFATGTFINRNSFATFLAAGLAMGAPLLLASLFEARRVGPVARFVQPALILLALAFIGAALVATGSRMGVLAGLVGAGLGLTAGTLAYGGPLFARLSLLALLLAAALGLFALYGSGLVERLVLLNGDANRDELYRQVWQAIWLRPWQGYGGGSFASAFPLFQRPPLAGDGVWDHSHSTYLALWFEEGLLFGALPLLAVGGLLLRALLRLRDPSSTLLSLASLAVVTVFALHSLVDFSAEIPANAYLLIAVLALGAAGGRGDAPAAPARGGR